jgi:PAS domain S-box-containing protein
MLAVALGGISTWFLVLPPSLSFIGKQPTSVYSSVGFLLIGSIVALLSGSLRMTNDAIRDREAQLVFMAAAMPEILFIADASGRIETLSERFREYTGRDLSALSSFGWMDVVHVEDRDSTLEAWETSVRERTEFRATCRLEGKERSHRWFQCRAVPMQNANKKVLRWFGVCADIDDRMRLEGELADQTQALRRSNEDLQRFAFAASHDLQEPLRMIGIFSDLLVRHQPKNDESDYFASQIKGGVRQMKDLLNSALEYPQITDSQPELNGVISLEQPLSDALWSLQAAIKESDAEIISEPLPLAKADPRLLTRVFQNLIGNAIKFRSRNRLAVRITAATKGEECVVSIADNGIGMPMEYAQYIFEAFRRLHPKSDYPGSGLGLASVKRIIELHRGRVWVESEPGAGSTFFFTLPSAEETA